MMILINNTTAAIVGCFETLDAAEAAADSRIPSTDDWVVWNEEDLASQPSAKEQIDLFNSVRDPETNERTNRFDSKAKGAAQILKAAAEAEEAGRLGKKTKKTRKASKSRNSGNCARVHAIADQLYDANEVSRKAVLEQAESEGIPRATASTQYQLWRKSNNL